MLDITLLDKKFKQKRLHEAMILILYSRILVWAVDAPSTLPEGVAVRLLGRGKWH